MLEEREGEGRGRGGGKGRGEGRGVSVGREDHNQWGIMIVQIVVVRGSTCNVHVVNLRPSCTSSSYNSSLNLNFRWVLA